MVAFCNKTIFSNSCYFVGLIALKTDVNLVEFHQYLQPLDDVLCSSSLQTNRGTQERNSGDQEDQIFRSEAEIPTGEKAVRCQGCY